MAVGVQRPPVTLIEKQLLTPTSKKMGDSSTGGLGK